MTFGVEDRIHEWLRQRLRGRGFDRIGDDGAVLPAGGAWTVTQDQQIEGVHFPPWLDPSLIARRLLSVNLSDLAAMAAEPAFAFLALSCPSTFDIRRFLASFIDSCGRHGVELAGGDLSRSDTVAASVTLLGRSYPGGRWSRRDAARCGDALWLAGDLGLSAAGRRLLAMGSRIEGRRARLPRGLDLTSREKTCARRAIWRHLMPRPQLVVGRWLSTRRRAAAIDVSDGFAVDLHRLCRASEVGAHVELRGLPISATLSRLCLKIGLDPLATILAGGEDYALLLALPRRARPPSDLGCRPIGRLTATPEVDLETPEGVRPLPASGWDHFRSPHEDGFEPP